MSDEPQPIVWPGQPYPLGSTWDGEGVNFALYSEHAEKVELCLFDSSGKRETLRVQIREQTDMVWHGYLPQLRPGQYTISTDCVWTRFTRSSTTRHPTSLLRWPMPSGVPSSRI